MTRSQQLLARALADVQTVPPREHKTYGSLCHRLPALVRRNGLCQTLAFLDSKKDAKRKDAHELLLEHLAAQLGVGRGDVLKRVGEAPLPLYMHQTRIVLSALSYYKRFAVSILHVDSTDEDEMVGTQ